MIPRMSRTFFFQLDRPHDHTGNDYAVLQELAKKRVCWESMGDKHGMCYDCISFLQVDTLVSIKLHSAFYVYSYVQRELLFSSISSAYRCSLERTVHFDGHQDTGIAC